MRDEAPDEGVAPARRLRADLHSQEWSRVRARDSSARWLALATRFAHFSRAAVEVVDDILGAGGSCYANGVQAAREGLGQDPAVRLPFCRELVARGLHHQVARERVARDRADEAILVQLQVAERMCASRQRIADT